ncbi:MAG TPA: Uma2 family endonuclease [Iamia sp.]|nr:Uma2 family endonuclease [Iamia sp.]
MTTYDSFYDQIPVPPELAEEVARRRAWGADRHDEVWDGEYFMSPWPSGRHALIDAEVAAAIRPYAKRVGLHISTAFNLGSKPGDFRVPDLGVHRTRELGVWNATAAIVVEVLSPGDRAWEKLGFYAEHHVDEVVMADPEERTVVWLARRGDTYVEVTRSEVLDVDVAEVAGQVDWR